MSGRKELDPDGVKISVWTDCKATRLHVDRIDRKKVAFADQSSTDGGPRRPCVQREASGGMR